MAVSMDMKLKDILKDEGAAAVLEKYFPGFTKHPQIKMGYMMTFRTISKFPQAAQMGLKPEILAKIEEEWKAL